MQWVNDEVNHKSSSGWKGTNAKFLKVHRNCLEFTADSCEKFRWKIKNSFNHIDFYQLWSLFMLSSDGDAQPCVSVVRLTGASILNWYLCVCVCKPKLGNLAVVRHALNSFLSNHNLCRVSVSTWSLWYLRGVPELTLRRKCAAHMQLAWRCY